MTPPQDPLHHFEIQYFLRAELGLCYRLAVVLACLLYNTIQAFES
jgi:hypothetical protein